MRTCELLSEARRAKSEPLHHAFLKKDSFSLFLGDKGPYGAARAIEILMGFCVYTFKN